VVDRCAEGGEESEKSSLETTQGPAEREPRVYALREEKKGKRKTSLFTQEGKEKEGLSGQGGADNFVYVGESKLASLRSRQASRNEEE